VCKGLRDLICSTEPGGPNNQAQPESCNGKDDDCDGFTDEDFLVGQLCDGAGECGEGVWECNGTSGRRCSTDPGGTADESEFELCNNKDDDCDGLIDEDFQFCDGTQSINNCGGCGNVCTVSHGVPECRDYSATSCGCEIKSCETSWHDTDALYSTGCECRDDEWDLISPTAGDSCGGPIQLNPYILKDNDGLRTTVSGNLAGRTDEDWFVFKAVDGAETGPNYGDEFNVQVIVGGTTTGEVVVDVYKNDCSNKICTGSPHFRYRTDSQFTSTGSGDPWYIGQKPCLPTNQTGCDPAVECNTPINWCVTEDITFIVRVYRVLPSGARATCGDYTLEVSNGFYSTN
jgi:hypothetical protein